MVAWPWHALYGSPNPGVWWLFIINNIYLQYVGNILLHYILVDPPPVEGCAFAINFYSSFSLSLFLSFLLFLSLYGSADVSLPLWEVCLRLPLVFQYHFPVHDVFLNHVGLLYAQCLYRQCSFASHFPCLRLWACHHVTTFTRASFPLSQYTSFLMD